MVRTCHELIASETQRTEESSVTEMICTKQNFTEINGEVYYLALLRSQGCNAPLYITKGTKFGTCAIGWPSLDTDEWNCV